MLNNTYNHPIIKIYKNTLSANIPLILIFGREPNTDETIINKVGHYDFREYPHCGFWNTSYSIIAKIVGTATAEFKLMCENKGYSPLAYCDSLPHGVKNEVSNKTAVRKQLTPTEVKNHIENIFSHTDLISRVKLIIISGCGGSEFAASNTAIEEKSGNSHVPCIKTPFFYGTNTQKILNALHINERKLISDIINT